MTRLAGFQTIHRPESAEDFRYIYKQHNNTSSIVSLLLFIFPAWRRAGFWIGILQVRWLCSYFLRQKRFEMAFYVHLSIHSLMHALHKKQQQYCLLVTMN